MKKSLTLKSEPNLHSRNNSIYLNHTVSFKTVLRTKNLKLTSYQVPEIQCMLCALIKLNCTCILKFCILLVKVKTWRAALSVTLPYKHSWRSRSAVKCISLYTTPLEAHSHWQSWSLRTPAPKRLICELRPGCSGLHPAALQNPQ